MIKMSITYKIGGATYKITNTCIYYNGARCTYIDAGCDISVALLAYNGAWYEILYSFEHKDARLIVEFISNDIPRVFIGTPTGYSISSDKQSIPNSRWLYYQTMTSAGDGGDDNGTAHDTVHDAATTWYKITDERLIMPTIARTISRPVKFDISGRVTLEDGTEFTPRDMVSELSTARTVSVLRKRVSAVSAAYIVLTLGACALALFATYYKSCS